MNYVFSALALIGCVVFGFEAMTVPLHRGAGKYLAMCFLFFIAAAILGTDLIEVFR